MASENTHTNSSAEKKNFLKNTSWLFGGGVGVSVFAMMETVLLARFFGLEVFGLFSIVTAYVRIVKEILDFKISEAVVKFMVRYRERKDKEKILSLIKFFYLIDFLMGIVAFITVILLAEIANTLFIKSPSAFELVFIYSFSLLVSTVNTTSQSILQVFNKFANVAFAELIAVVLRVSLVVGFLIAGFGVREIFLAHVAGAFAHFAVLQVFVNRTLKKEGASGWLRGNLKIVLGELRNIMIFILNSTVVSFVGKVFNREFPILVLGHFFTNEVAGLYKVATSFSKVIGKLQSPTSRAIYPAIMSLEENDSHSAFKQLVSYSIKLLAKFLIPIGAVFFIFADRIISTFFGAEYVPAANAMRIIVVADVLIGLTFWLPAVYLTLGKIWFRTGLTFFSAFVYTIALLYLSPLYSIEGASFARVIFSVTIIPFALFLFRDIRKRGKEKNI